MNQSSALAAPAGSGSDFDLSDAAFNRIRELVREHTGIALSEAKRQLVYGRLSRRLRTLGLEGFRDYIELLEKADPAELEEFTNAITTNLTSFFRESHHFEHFANQVLPAITSRRPAASRLRIWSSACSTGEEPYSISMVLRENQGLLAGVDTRILATDLDSQVLATAASGVYSADRLQSVSKARISRHFRQGGGAHQGKVRVDPELKESITFRQLNLMHEWPMQGPFDVIFCRNVVIYFDKSTQRTLFERMATLQRPGATLYLGHSESLYRVCDKYELVGRTIYRRVGA